MWGFEPKYVDMFLAKNADFIQSVVITDPETGEEYAPPAGSEVFFRVGDDRWDGTLIGAVGNFKIESEVADLVKRNTPVQFCVSVADDDWVLTQGRVIRG